MDTIDKIATFLTAPTEKRLRLVLDQSYSKELRSYLGDRAYNEYQGIAKSTLPKLDKKFLGGEATKNLIFVPGVMGSLLKSNSLGGIWWIDIRTRSHINDLKLGPNGEQDAIPNHQVVPCTVDTSYEPFLAAVLEREGFGHEVFPYDWRKSLNLSSASLKNKIIEIYEGNGKRLVHLVAHSMGGLLVRVTLMSYGDELWKKVGRIVFIGTPHYGSPAICGFLKNHLWGFEWLAVLGLYLSRETFRSLWGVISLLPAPKGIYPGTRDGEHWSESDPLDPYPHPCSNFDMYNANSWQLELTPAQKSDLQKILTGAATFHQQIYSWHHSSLDQNLRDKMAVIAGVGFKTLFRLTYHKSLSGIWNNMDKTTTRVPGDPNYEGDGRVPLASAQLENVCETRYVKGVHDGLPNISEVYEDVFRWLNEEQMQLPESPAEAISQHLSVSPPISRAPNLDGTIKSIPNSDDPGYWNLNSPDDARMNELKAAIETEQAPEFVTVRLL